LNNDEWVKVESKERGTKKSPQLINYYKRTNIKSSKGKTTNNTQGNSH